MALSVGERLKSAREAKGIVMEEACRVTKIQRKILEGIEKDRLQEMLDPAYARIFLKKYAAYLGVDGAAMVQEYLSTRGAAPQAATPAGQTGGAPARQVGQLDSPELRPLLVAAGVGLAALVGVGFLVYLGLDLAGNLKESRRAPAPASIAVEARARSGASGAAVREQAQERKPASRPLLVPLSKKLQLTVQTSASVWLQVKADGSVVFQNVLAKGARESWGAQRELELWTGNAGAMALTLNGKPLEGVGRGVRKGIRITHSGIEP
ncbi:MAG: DUF4115 domain-containing protein [Candidatus Omnitrophica bacterium]|nr:DUF4115 domain-containing protein [Candidatus Omnitrophota bacterium]